MTVGIASGADDDDCYDRTPSKRNGSGRSPFGFGGGGGSAGRRTSGGNKGGRSFSNRDVWDKRQGIGGVSPRGHGGQGGGGGSVALIVFSVAFVLTALMGGATFHYRRAIDRINHELVIVERQTKGRRHLNRNPLNRFQKEEDDDDEDDDDGEVEEPGNNSNSNDAGDGPKVSPQYIADLQTKKRDLEGEFHRWSARHKSTNNEILALKTQAEHLETAELNAYRQQLTSLQTKLTEEETRGKEFKDEFVKTHEEGNSGIVPGGPGHALVQKKEIQGMESLDDYEDYVQRREDALWEKIDMMVEKLGKESEREATEWFGPGPHEVELEIEYPKYLDDVEPASWPRTRGTFRMEMAPLPLMPIAVNLFLQQVHHKLWNGSSFVINAMHILQAGPHTYSEGPPGSYDANIPELAGKFESARLDKMPFQEYSKDYPHAKYTLGFAGRPGGPDFYINKIDNSVNHGPGGQSHHDLHEEADPCFAKLVKGMEILDELNMLPTDMDRGSLLLASVAIVDSRVVVGERKEVKEDGQKEQNDEKNDENQQEQQSKEKSNAEDNPNNDQGIGGGNKMPAMGPGRI